MKRVRAGILRHPIFLQREIESVGEIGQVIHTWTNLYHTRAHISPVNGTEWYINDHLQNEVTHNIVVRDTRTTKHTPKDRIIFGARIFDIIKILNFEERQMHLMILAKERYEEVYLSPIVNRILEDGTDRVLEDGTTLRILEN